MTKHPIILVLAALLAGCATTGSGGGGLRGKTDVTRYHLGQPIAPGTIVVEPLLNGAGATPEYQLYADAVTGEVAKLGFQPSPKGTPSEYIAVVGFRLTPVGTVRKPPPITIGIGGGSFGRGGGLGGGVSAGFGGKTRTVLATELTVQLRRRADGTVVWEGRAQRAGIEGRDQATPTADILADAMFRGFPGESGITISVP